ncbi:MAG: citrate (Si)-synthase [Nitrospirae bacterium GWC2_57_13]|nr:MAG: citrate (Si)-synthase [Nitrospirae bacterium GWC2_57_13]OGW41361.1 MAG: citrate (Si)-synthase [Nitrospirae bacterium GWD2_57_8]HAS53322.1 citrate (Si)-synthase [Nitrospiraceae bacterium]
MAESEKIKNTGLRGVTVADTKVSLIDGQNGILIYRGYRIEELARNSTYEETAYLLLHDALPGEKTLMEFTAQLIDARTVPGFVIESLKQWPREARPMDVLQAAIPLLAITDHEAAEETREANIRKAIRLIARMPVIVAAWHRIRSGQEPVLPDKNLSHAANFLSMLHGKKPDAETARDFDVCLVLHADHTFNASTFAAREVVSTQAHMYAGVAAAVGALSGSLHGGANARVIKMLLELTNEKDIPGWVKQQLVSGKKIMGLGHAVYKTMDPRARFLKEMGGRLGSKLGLEWLHTLSVAVEENAVREFEARGKTTIKPNVDFFSAPVYHMMGIPADIMTPVFAISRIAGWAAHIIEEKFGDAQEKPALYRPESEYVGNYCGKTGCVYEPMGKRPG